MNTAQILHDFPVNLSETLFISYQLPTDFFISFTGLYSIKYNSIIQSVPHLKSELVSKMHIYIKCFKNILIYWNIDQCDFDDL